MVQRKNKPSFFARASLFIKRLWQFVSVDIWHVTEYKLHIHILKTLNLSVRCFLNEKLQEKASALTFSTIYLLFVRDSDFNILYKVSCSIISRRNAMHWNIC